MNAQGQQDNRIKIRSECWDLFQKIDRKITGLYIMLAFAVGTGLLNVIVALFHL